MGIAQFSNPSAVVPTNAGGKSGFFLFNGGSSGDDGRHQITLEYAPLLAADQLPVFKNAAFTDTTGSNPKPTSTNLITRNGAFNRNPIYAFALDENTIQLVYGGAENNQGGVWGHSFVVSPDGTLNRVIANQCLTGNYGGAFSDAYAYEPQMSVATIPGEPTFLVACSNSDNNLAISSYRLQADLTQPLPAGQSVFDQQNLIRLSMSNIGGAYNWHGDISLVVVPNSVDGSADLPFYVFAVLSYLNEAFRPAASMMFMCRLGLDANRNPVLYSLTNLPIRSLSDMAYTTIGQSFQVLGLFRGADGMAYCYASDRKNLFCTQVLPDAISDDSIFGSLNNSPLTPQLSGVTQAPAIFTTFGEFPAPDTAGTVPVYRWFLFRENSYWMNQVGQAQRKIYNIPANQGDQMGHLIGIFEGGPPVPNENIQGADLAASDTFGTTLFGNEVAKATEWSFKSSIGMLFKFKSVNGIKGICAVTTSFSLAAGVTGGFTRSSETIILNSYLNKAQGAQKDNQNAIQTTGLAVIYFPAYTGYEYIFLDNSGNPDPNAPSCIELFPLDTDGGSTLATPPFDFDPSASAGIIPGELLSYVADSNDIAQWEANKLQSVNVSFGQGGGSKPKSEQISSGSQSVGGYFDFEASVGAEFGDELDVVGGEAGVQLKVDFDHTWKQSDTTTLEADLADMPGLSDEDIQRGAFTSYAAEVYMLNLDVAHTTELLNLLKQYPTENNQYLLSKIHPQSAPWKITYALTQQYQPHPPTGPGVAAVRFPGALKRAGITDPQLAWNMHQALEQLGASGLAVAAEHHALARQLTPEQQALLGRYIARVQQRAIRAFRGRHPRWRRARHGARRGS